MAGRHNDEFDFSDGHALQARLFKISSEQQSIISRDHAWNLSPSNIPNAVLEHITAHLVRQREAEVVANATQPQATEAISPPNPARSSPKIQEPERFESQAPESADELDDEDQNDGNVKSPANSWSPSPPHHMHPPDHVTDSRQDDFLTQLPEETPPQPTAFRCSKFSRPGFEFPSSSAGQDDDELEIDIPTRVEIPATATIRAAVQTMATPPSAQIVPCSMEPLELITREPARPKSRGGSKQTRYVSVTALYRPDKPAEPAVSITNEPSKLTEDSGSHSQPSTFSSDTSSVIPSTHQVFTHEQSLPPDSSESRGTDPRVSPKPPLGTPGPETIASRSPAAKDIAQQPAVESTASPRRAQAPSESARRLSSPTDGHDAGEQHASPYARYCNAYKDYQGSVQSFVTACIYIQLQHKKIRSSLYDDFIRAWQQGYYAYVKACDTAVPPQTAIHAYAWYNEMDDDPLYNSRVITKQNLRAALDFYPDEVKSAQRSLGIIQEEEPFSSQRPGKPDIIHGPSESLPRLVSPPPNVGSPAANTARHDSHDQEAQVADPSSPERIILDESSVAVHSLDFSKSMSEIDIRQQPATRSLARSYSEAAKHKRKASVETAERQPKRQPMSTVNILPEEAVPPPSPSQVSIRPRESRGSPVGSLASVDFQTPSSSDMRKRRFGNNPEKRKERFRQFLLKQKRSAANEAIMSSAPTSAQRH